MADVILRGKQAAFVEAYVANELLPVDERLSLSQIAVKAGVAEISAANYGAKALQLAPVQAAIAERKRNVMDSALGLGGVDAKAVVAEWVRIAFADATKIAHVRRLNCRHCYGFNHAYQWTDAEFARAQAEEMQDAIHAGREMNTAQFEGGSGFRLTADPHPDCPECGGEGLEDVYVADMRKLPKALRRMVASVERTKNGVKVTMRNQDEALSRLANFLGLSVQKNEHAGPNGGAIPVAQVNYTLPSDPQEASRHYQMLMEGNK